MCCVASYDRHQQELEEKLDEKTAALIHLQRVTMEHNAASPVKNNELEQALGAWGRGNGRRTRGRGGDGARSRGGGDGSGSGPEDGADSVPPALLITKTHAESLHDKFRCFLFTKFEFSQLMTD